MVELRIKARPEHTDTVCEFVTTGLESNSVPADMIPEIIIAIEEIFTNIAQYAYPPDQEGDVAIYTSFDEQIVIRFEDSGQPFDPLKRKGPDLDTPLMERKIGGLGIHFVKNLMDKVEYEYTDKKNVLTISKGFLAPGKEERACSRV